MNREQNKAVSNFNIGNFIKEESLGGIVVIFVTIIALIWANSGFYEFYHYLWHEIKVGFKFGDFKIESSIKPLDQRWIDGIVFLYNWIRDKA